MDNSRMRRTTPGLAAALSAWSLLVGLPFVGCSPAASADAPALPTVMWSTPSPGALDYLVGGQIAATFSEDMEAATLDSTSFQVTSGGVVVPGTVSYAARVASFAPADALKVGTVYRVTLAASIKSQRGPTLTHPYAWSFKSASLAGWRQPVRIGSTRVLDGVVHPVVRLGAEVYAAWEHVGAERVEVRVSRLNAIELTWFPGSALDAGTGDSDRPRLAVGNGNATVLWNQGGALYASRGNDRDDTWSAPWPVSDSVSAPDPATHRIGCGTNGDAVATWSSQGRIFAADYNPLTDTWSPPFRVDAGGGGEDPAVSVEASGDATVVWARAAAVYGASKIAVSGLWTPEEAISTGDQVPPAGGRLRPDVIRMSGFNTFVAWAGAVAGTPGSTHVRVIQGSARSWRPEVTIWSMPGQLPDPAPTFAPHAGPDFLLTWNIRGARPKAGVSLFTNGAWQVPDTSLPAGPEVSGAIVSLSDQTPPRSLLVTVRKSVDLSFRASPSSAWSTVALGTGASAAAVFDSWDRPVVVWSAAAGADGVFAVVP